MAMPWGRSVVTLQGPSLARRSASARRWRMDSCVQASLRTMAECRASASASETRVMGMPAAWAQDTSVTTRTAVFTITDCSGYDMGRWENPGTDRTDTDCSGYRLGRWGQTGDRGRKTTEGSGLRTRGQTGLAANFRQTAPEIHVSLVSPLWCARRWR